jgi:hypothetical protein
MIGAHRGTMPLATGTRLAGILTFAFRMTSENMKARPISCRSTWKAKPGRSRAPRAASPLILITNWTALLKLMTRKK